MRGITSLGDLNTGSGAVGDLRYFRTKVGPFDTVNLTKWVPLTTYTQFDMTTFPALAKNSFVLANQARALLPADDQVSSPGIALNGGVFIGHDGCLYGADSSGNINRQANADGTGAWSVVRSTADVAADIPDGSGVWSCGVSAFFYISGVYFRLGYLRYWDGSTEQYYPRIWRATTPAGTWTRVLNGYSGDISGLVRGIATNGARLVACTAALTASGSLRYSADGGVTWVTGTGTGVSSHAWAWVLWTGTKFLAFSTDGYTAASTDGAAWTVTVQTGASKPSLGVSRLIPLVVCGSYIWGGDGGAGGYLVYSTDGIAWSRYQLSGTAGITNSVGWLVNGRGLTVFASQGSGNIISVWEIAAGNPVNIVEISVATVGADGWLNSSSVLPITFGAFIRLFTGNNRTLKMDDLITTVAFYSTGAVAGSPYALYIRGKL